MRTGASRTIRRAILGVVAICLLGSGGSSYGASKSSPQTRKHRPRVKVEFDRPNYLVSYGGTLDLCMKVTPVASANFSPLKANPFSSNPAEALTGNFGGAAQCAAGFSKIQLGASLAVCEAAPSFIVTTNGRPRRASLPGTVMLPDIVRSTVFANPGCPVGFGISKEFAVRFKSSQGANPSFDELSAHENLTFPVDGCGMEPAKLEGTWTLGRKDAPEDPTPPTNSLIDANTFCATEPIWCTTTIKQTFTIGACTTSPPTTITFQMAGTTGDVTRDDMGAQ